MNRLLNDLQYNFEEVVNNLNKIKHKELLDHLSTKYYDEGISLISDELFDYILEKYNDKYDEYIYNDDGTREKATLPYYVGSQNKIKASDKTINSWLKKYKGPYVLSTKINGVSGLLHNDNGIVRLFTKDRTGLKGYEKTKYLNKISIDCSTLNVGDAIRGELIISKKHFKKYYSDEYSDTLSAVAGILNSDSSSENKLKYIEFVAFGVVNPVIKSSEQYEYLESCGFKTAKHSIVDEINKEMLTTMLVDERQNYKYDIDGIVVCDNSKAHVLIESQNPKYSFAFKTILNDQVAETIVTGIEWNVQKNGKIFPTIKFDSVTIMNKNIDSVTGYHAKYIRENCIGTGSKLIIIKSGDVIPNIHKVLTLSSSGEPDFPKIPYSWDETNTHILSTSNDANVEKIIKEKQLGYTFKMLGVSFFGPANIHKFVEHGYDNIFKILKANKEEIATIDRFSDKVVNKMYDSLTENIANAKLENLMAASNCFGAGVSIKTFQSIIESYPNILDLYKNNDKTYIYNIIINLHGFQQKTTEKISNNIGEFYKWYNKLNKIIPIANLNQNKQKTNDSLNGKTYVFSGIRDKELEKKIIDMGGKIGTSVNKKTTALVVKDINSTSGKINEARNLNVQIISISNFENNILTPS